MEAVNKYNGQDLAGRKMLVREDREDRDVKQYNRENGIERPEGARAPRRPRRSDGGGAPGGGQQAQGEGRPPKREGGPPERQGESSGFQVQGGCLCLLVVMAHYAGTLTNVGCL